MYFAPVLVQLEHSRAGPMLVLHVEEVCQAPVDLFQSSQLLDHSLECLGCLERRVENELAAFAEICV